MQENITEEEKNQDPHRAPLPAVRRRKGLEGPPPAVCAIYLHPPPRPQRIAGGNVLREGGSPCRRRQERKRETRIRITLLSVRSGAERDWRGGPDPS